MSSRNQCHFEFFKKWDFEEEDDYIYGDEGCDSDNREVC